MSTLAIKTYITVSDVFANIGQRVIKACEQVGYARAAAELYRLGYHAEAKKLILMKNKLETTDA